MVGNGSFDWMMTVVGLLIAGEIYIHFSNKDVQNAKMTELLKAVKKSVPQVSVPDAMGSVQGGVWTGMLVGQESMDKLPCRVKSCFHF